MQSIHTTCTRRYCVCAGEHIKLVSTLDGRFPDFGHHLPNEMGGLWMPPVKLLDGFWMHFLDRDGIGDCWLSADGYTALPEGNLFHFRQGMGPTPIQIDLHQLAPDEARGVVLRYEVRNTGAAKRRIALDFLARTDLRPAWSARFLDAPQSGRDSIRYRPEYEAFHADTEGRPWHVLFGADAQPASRDCGDIQGPDWAAGEGASGRMHFEWELDAGETRVLQVFVAGSFSSLEDCAAQYRLIAQGGEALWQKKRERTAALDSRARLSVDDRRFSDIYSWVKYNTDWLILDTPAGRGIGGGIPEYAWWFGCDSCYTVQGLLCMGDAALCRDTLHLLLEASRTQCGSGKIIHEVITDGSVYHDGNTQETAHFIIALWLYYQWTGDKSLLQEALPYLDKSVDWLIAQDTDGDLFPSGYGIMEVQDLDLELIDAAVYTAKAFGFYAAIRRTLGIQDERNARFESLAARMEEKINVDFWDPDAGLYSDVFASIQDVQDKLDAILKNTPPAYREQVQKQMERAAKKQEAETGWLLNKNWVIGTPMEMEIAPREKADRALARMHTEEFVGEWGVYLSGVAQREIMTINTGVVAAAQVRYGYADRALELLERMLATFGKATPGCLSEMSPDYGCFVQGWTAYAMFVPVVSGFFGVRPQADKGEIELRPCMPSRWGRAELKDLPVLGGELSLAFRREGGRETLEIDNRTPFPVRLAAGEGRLLPPGKHETVLAEG